MPSLTFGALSYDSHCVQSTEWFDTQEKAEESLSNDAQGYLDAGERVPFADDWAVVKLVKSGSMKAEPFDCEYFQMEAVNA